MDGRYVVGIDGSGPSSAAMAWAATRSRQDGAPLALVHVAETDDGMMGPGFAEAATRAGAELLSAAARSLGDELTVTEHLLEGPVPWALAQFVTARDVIVVGTHKTGFLHGRVLGSRSVQIAAVAPCSVAVVPEVDLRFRHGVVVGVDRVETAERLGRAAAREALALGQELVVIQAGVSAAGALTAPALAAAVSAARGAATRLEIRSRASNRPAAEALLDAARDKAMLVLGPGSTEATRSLIGTVLHDVLLNVNAPVLIARPAEDREVSRRSAGGVIGRA